MTRLASNFSAAPRGDPITHNRCTALPGGPAPRNCANAHFTLVESQNLATFKYHMFHQRKIFILSFTRSRYFTGSVLSLQFVQYNFD